MRPLLFLDLDDTICLNTPHGGYDAALQAWPEDLPARLWHQPALSVLEPIVRELNPNVVITSSWLRLMLLERLTEVFRRTGIPWLSERLHPEGEALQIA